MLVVALYMAEYLMTAALYDANGWLGISDIERAALAVVLGYGCVLTVVMHVKGLSYSSLFHSSVSSNAATLLLLPAIALTIPVQMLANSAMFDALQWLSPLSAAEQAIFSLFASGSLAILVMTCVLAPVLEEMLFRGIILRSFLKQFGRWPAIFGSAFLFGVAHMNMYQFMCALLIGWALPIAGLALGWLYERTRSLIPCIALHAMFNITGTLLGSDETDYHSAAYWLVAMLLAASGTMMLRKMLILKP